MRQVGPEQSGPTYADLMSFPTMSCRQTTIDGPGRCQESENLHGAPTVMCNNK